MLAVSLTGLLVEAAVKRQIGRANHQKLVQEPLAVDCWLSR